MLENTINVGLTLDQKRYWPSFALKNKDKTKPKNALGSKSSICIIEISLISNLFINV